MLVRDPISDEWLLRAPLRGGRPNEFASGPDTRCAFCPGSEDLTPPEIARIASGSAWAARAFRNKFPAIEPPDGRHEVIVDGPDHVHECTKAGVAMWRERYDAALAEMPASFPVLFKNCGALAGATQLHPHTQLVVLPQRPARWASMEAAARAYLHVHDRCIWCDEAERNEGEGLLVLANDSVRAYVRDTSRFFMSLTILPRECRASSYEASERTWNGIAAVLERIASRLRAEFGETCAFNMLVIGDPHTSAFHWHIEAIVRVNTLAGFELATGIFISEGSAKESAERWRRTLALPDRSI